jgi:microcystin-dependent protein
MQAEEIFLEVRDKNLKRLGQIEPQFLDMSARRIHCGVGNWSIRLPTEHKMVPHLRTAGSGVIIKLRGKTFMSGPTLKPSSKASPEDPGGIVTFTGVDDNIILAHALAWPQPGNPDPSTQTLSHDVRTGVAETVMRAYVNANIGPGAPADRRGLLAGRLALATDQARGLTVNKSARFPVLGELLADIAAYSRLGFNVVQVGDTLEFQVYSINDRKKFVRFDIHNGTLSEQSIETSAPTVTRPLVAGQGEGVDRQILQRTNSISLQAEIDWGFKIERFIDQRQTNVVAELQQAGDSALFDGGFTSTSVKAIPSDDMTMQYAKDWKEGDEITVVIDGQQTSSTVTEVSIVVNAGGANIGAAIGDVSGFDATSALERRVDDTQRRVDQLERNLEVPDTIPSTSLTGTIDPDRLPPAGYIPPGVSWEYAGATAPAGWLLENGAAYDRTTYAALFAVIGTTYGAGNGSTTFNVPNRVDKFGVGAGSAYARGATGGEASHILAASEMPTHTHIQNAHNHTQAAHNHTQNAHGHNVNDPSHNHSQNAHSHSVTSPGSIAGPGGSIWADYTSAGGTLVAHLAYDYLGAWGNPFSAAAVAATNNGAYTGLTVVGNTATNIAATATNDAATATNQNAGGGGAHNNLPPYVAMNYIIKT